MSILGALNLPKPRAQASAPPPPPPAALDAAAVRAEADKLSERLARDRAAAANVRAQFAAQQAQFAKRVSQASAADKEDLEGRKGKLDATVAQLDGVIARLDGDLKTLSGKGADAKVLVEVVARNKLPQKTAVPTKIDAGDIVPTAEKWIPPSPSATGGTTQTTPLGREADGTAVVRSKSDTWKLGEQGLSSSQQDLVTKARPDGSFSQTATTQTTSFDGKQLTAAETKARVDVDAKGGERKTEVKTEATIGPGSSSLTHSVDQTRPDGSGSSASIGVKQGGGELSLSGGGSNTRVDATGNKDTSGLSGSSTLVAGAGGIGAKGDLAVNRSKEKKDGPKKARTVKFNGGLVANIVPLAGTEPAAYKVSIRMSLGVGVDSSKAKEWKDKGKLDVSARLGVEVWLEHSEELDADATARYEAALAEAAKGGGSTAGKEFEIIRAAVGQGPEVARAMWLALKGELGKPSALAKLKPGQENAVGTNTNAGGGGSGQLGPITAAADLDVKMSDSTRVAKRKDGTVEFEQNKEASGTASGTLGFKAGLVGGSFGGKLTAVTKSGLKIVVEPSHRLYQVMAANLATCESQDDIEMFAREYPDAVERSATTGGGTGTTTGMSVGPLSGAIDTGHANQSTVKRDGSGKVIGTEDIGTSERGASAELGPLKAGGKGTDTATAKTDEQGRAQLDLQHKSEETGPLDSLVAAGKGLAQRLMPDSLGDLTGGNAPQAKTTVKIAGLTLNTQDLAAIGGLAMRNDPRWRSAFVLPADSADWRKAQAEIVDADGDPAAVGRALSHFEGSSDRERLKLLVHFLRPGGSVAVGKRVELPDELKHLAADYQAAVLDEPHEALEFIASKKGDAKMRAQGEAVLGQLDKLETAIDGCETFRNPAARTEMLAQIRRTRVLVRIVLDGQQSRADSSTPEYQALMASVQNCEGHQKTAGQLGAKMAEMSQRFTRAEDKLAVLRSWEDVVALWARDWASILYIAPNIGMDVKQWSRLKPVRTALDDWTKKTRIQGG